MERITLDRWFSLLLAFLSFGGIQGQTVDALARAFHDAPTARTRAPLAVYASAHPTTVDGALASLALGVKALDDDPSEAIRQLSAAQRRLPALADYTALWLAMANSRLQNSAAVPTALEPVWAANPVSAIGGRAATVGAKAYLDLQQPRSALALLTRLGDQLPQPTGLALLARAHEDVGDLTAAVAWYQSVYYGYPRSAEADEARTALVRLESSMRERYPPAMPKARLDRATTLMEARQYTAARSEFLQLSRDLAGGERDVARVRVGACDYYARKTKAAILYLRALSAGSGEADAERLYYLAASHLRANQTASIGPVLAELASRHPTSVWRLKALMMASNGPLVQNDSAAFLPLYKACADDFAGSPEAAICHWRVTWNAWISRSPEAGVLLKEHLNRYPNSEKANAALYFLGRLNEAGGNYAAARRLFEEIPVRYPNSYYTLLVRERLKTPEIANAGPSPRTDEFLAEVPAVPRVKPAIVPDAISTKRIERARLLARAGLDAWSDGELRYGARREGQPFVMAMELADLAHRRGQVAVGLRHIKGTASGYLSMPREFLPDRFWRFAFPIPYRADIEQRAAEYGIDRWVLAGLIRQESEFDPAVVSYARAIGLTQVMPGTGRELARKLGVRGYSTAKLKLAELNLRFGSHYLGRIIESFGGRLEPALASYNAGKSRADRWLTWADYREPAEFIENIPFTQTREYVQVILRNADVYRSLYQNVPITAAPAYPRPREEAPRAAKPKPAAKSTSKAKPKSTRSKGK